MKIAAITVTYNDDYKFNEWVEHYNEYKQHIHKNIIVDNGSELSYLNQVKEAFHDSIIIERDENGGSTKAYNDGIKVALEDKEIDAILLIGNDIKLKNLDKLYDFLYSKKELGMVAPVLLSKNSDIIEDYGCKINKFLNLEPKYVGCKYTDNNIPINYNVDTVTGGMNLSKVEFYRQVGLQDEKLFMYSDEVDMGLRTKKSNFKIAVTTLSIAWHEHINPSSKNIRNGYSQFLARRNKIYLAYKHFGLLKALSIFVFQIAIFPKMIFFYSSKKSFKLSIYYILGSLFGILKIQNNFNFIINNKI